MKRFYVHTNDDLTDPGVWNSPGTLCSGLVLVESTSSPRLILVPCQIEDSDLNRTSVLSGLEQECLCIHTDSSLKSNCGLFGGLEGNTFPLF